MFYSHQCCPQQQLAITLAVNISFSFPAVLFQLRPWCQGGALPGQGEAMEPLLRRSEGRGQRSFPVPWPVPAAPRLPAHVVAAVRQIRAACTAAGLRGHSIQQRLRRGERGCMSAAVLVLKHKWGRLWLCVIVCLACCIIVLSWLCRNL